VKKMNKKGVSGVIVTVLLILIVIAAIGILAAVILPWIEQGIGGGTKGVQGCIETSLSITTIDSSEKKISVKRTAGNAEIERIKVLVEGTDSSGDTFGAEIGIGEIVTTESISNLTSEQEVEVGAIIDGRDCGVIDKAIVP
jgi:flagellin-like protein